MKGKKHKPEQIIRKLREADAMLSADKSVGQVCQALEISEQTFNRWRNQSSRWGRAQTKARVSNADAGHAIQ
jgi:transposase-like protein